MVSPPPKKMCPTTAAGYAASAPPRDGGRTMIVSRHEEMNPKRRSTMEDSSVTYLPGQWGSTDLALLGVYDGHGGRDVVDFLEERLHLNLAREIGYRDGGEKGGGDLGVRIERALLLTDVQSRRAGLMTSGSTVALCLVGQVPLPPLADGAGEGEGRNRRGRRRRRRRVTIHAANVGDARAVLSRSASGGRGGEEETPGRTAPALRLTRDHRADDPTEVRRIERAGGFVAGGRVLGILAVARSLGDHGLKEYVTARPHLSETVIDVEDSDSEDEDEDGGGGGGGGGGGAGGDQRQFLIVACDGLWDVVEDQDAVDLVREAVSGGTATRETAAEMLVREALRRGSTDNVTAIVAWL